MTMPSKGRREITVGKVLYHYTIKSVSYGLNSVVIENTKTGKNISYQTEQESITPKDISTFITATDLWYCIHK